MTLSHIPARPRKTPVMAALVLLAALIAPAPLLASSGPEDHRPTTSEDRAKTVPLYEIIKKIKRDFGGKLLEVELENERIGGMFILVYDAKILMPEGDVLKLYFDAKTTKLLKMKGHYKRPHAEYEKYKKEKKKKKKKYDRKKYDDDDDDDDHKYRKYEKYDKYDKYNRYEKHED